MPFQFQIQPQNTALQTLQVVEAMEGQRERRDLQRQSLQLRMQEAASKMDERQKARAKDGLEGMARVAGAARNAQEWDAGIQQLVAQGFKEFEGELGKWSPDRASFNLRRAQDTKTLFESSPEQRAAKVQLEADKFNATIPGRMMVAREGRSNVSVNVDTAQKPFYQEVGKAAAKGLDDSLQRAQSANDALSSISRAQKLLDDGIIAGTGAGFRASAERAFATAGLIDGDRVANTEAFQAEMGRQVFSLIKALGSGTGVSNTDRDYTEKVAGGNVSLSEEGLKRILRIGRQVAEETIAAHNKRVAPMRGDPNIPGFIADQYTVTRPAPEAPRQTPQPAPADPRPQRPLSSNPNPEAVRVRDMYRNGQITREEARKRLEAMGYR